MCVELKTIVDNGMTYEQYILRGIRVDLGHLGISIMPLDVNVASEVCKIYTRLGILQDLLDNDLDFDKLDARGITKGGLLNERY